MDKSNNSFHPYYNHKANATRPNIPKLDPIKNPHNKSFDISNDSSNVVFYNELLSKKPKACTKKLPKTCKRSAKKSHLNVTQESSLKPYLNASPYKPRLTRTINFWQPSPSGHPSSTILNKEGTL